MKVSEITSKEVADYIRLDDSDPLLEPILNAAKKYISSYTGIPEKSLDTTGKSLDDYEDFYIVVMILCQDMHDNRSMYIEKSNLNKVVETVLGMHRTNLLPTPDEVIL